ncbi:MAG: hypothetical protein RBJ76_13635 [Stenomitos frigidus ULC029]
MTKILAIDPGSTLSGFVVWDGKTILAKSDGTKENKGKTTNGLLLSLLRSKDGFPGVTDVVIEGITLYQRADMGLRDTIIWSGRFAEAWHFQSSKETAFINRADVKTYFLKGLSGTDKNDATMKMALIDRFGAPGTKDQQGVTFNLKYDQWQAFGLAAMYYDQLAVTQAAVA